MASAATPCLCELIGHLGEVDPLKCTVNPSAPRVWQRAMTRLLPADYIVVRRAVTEDPSPPPLCRA